MSLSSALGSWLAVLRGSALLGEIGIVSRECVLVLLVTLPGVVRGVAWFDLFCAVVLGIQSVQLVIV